MASSPASPAERGSPCARRLGRAACVAALLTLGAAPASAETLPVADLPSLLAGMRSSPGVVARFTEVRELALLSSPLEAAGTIYFVPPSRMVRVVTRPGRSRFVVDGDKVRFEDEAGSRGLDLAASPMARQMIDSFVVLFSGDEARLKSLYVAEFRGDAAAWTLKLTPRSAPLDRMIAYFELSGREARIDRMVAAEPDGDRTVTTFGETDARHLFGEKELSELFAEPPAS
jgi:outer membrane lipoprotein-sorting protein